MQCPNCSTENPTGATFCQHCGASLNASAAPPPAGGGYTEVSYGGAAASAPPPPGYSAPGYAPQAAGLSDNAAAAIAYITFIPAIIFLVIEPYSRRPFVRFHAWQCIGLTVASVALHFAIGALVFVLHSLAFMLSSLVSLVFFALWVICIISAAQGKWFKVPVIGDLAMQQSHR